MYLWDRYHINLRANFVLSMIITRGLLTSNCHGWSVSETLLKDASGVELYRQLKASYGDFVETNMMGQKIYIVTNNKYQKYILDHSPDLFSVGKLKDNFFQSFMAKNVGVSKGQEWKMRRIISEKVLDSEMIPRYAQMYHDLVGKLVRKKIPVKFDDFVKLGQELTMYIVFGDRGVVPEMFDIFKEANSLSAVWKPGYKIDPNILNVYRLYMRENIRCPRKGSLVELGVKLGVSEEEMIHHIPHWIFPLAGLAPTSVSRMLFLLCNHPKKLYKLRKEMKQVNLDDPMEVYQFPYLRACIMETLRLNNPVVSMFRTLEKPVKMGGKQFNKGDQFLILNNPVLREQEFWPDSDKFVPERWLKSDLEQSPYAVSFGHGPQRCPGKEMAIFLIGSCVTHILRRVDELKCQKIKTEKMPQMINPCRIQFKAYCC